MIYADRRDAGRALARRLEPYRGAGTLVLGLARGGVPVAYEVARALGAELDVFVARKLGAPGNPEFGFGAVAGEVVVLDAGSVAELGLASEEIDAIAARERAEAARREACFRAGRPAPPVAGRTVILVDDGLATGVTAQAACDALRRAGPARLVLAAPVGSASAVARLAAHADQVVCAAVPADFAAVGQFYREFGQTGDDEVVALLRR